MRQRLLAIETAEAAPAERLRNAASAPVNADGTPAPAGEPAPKPSYGSVSGSVSSTYIRDDSYSINRDPTQALNLNKTREDLQTHQNEVMSSFDTTAQWGDGNVKMKFRFSGTNEYRIEPTAEDLFGVSSLYLDTSVKDWGTTFRLGRQIRNSDGILGRFDGAVFTYQYDPIFGFTTFGGSPVDYRTDTPLKDDRYFYGGALNVGPWKGLDADVYAIEQMDRNIVDRQAVGAEFRYNDMTKSAFLTVDYDVHFDKLDAAIFTGTWTLAGQIDHPRGCRLPDGSVSDDVERFAGPSLHHDLRSPEEIDLQPSRPDADGHRQDRHLPIGEPRLYAANHG